MSAPNLVSKKQWLTYNILFVIEHFIGLKLSEKFIRPRRIRLYNKLLKHPYIEKRGETINTQTIEFKDFDSFIENKSQLLKRPLVFRGIAKNWPAVQKWSKEYFRQKYAAVTVPLVDKIPGIRDDKGKYGKIDFSTYFEEIDKGENIYLSFSRLIDNNPELLEDLDLTWLRQFQFGMCNGEQTFIFMGEKGTKTDMHNGFTHTLFIQIQGKKKWTLYHPNERFFLDPCAGRHTHYYTHANPNKQDDIKYPLLKYAKKYEIVCEAGDVLWFPSLFWHYVENPESNIGVAFKFVNVPQSFQISKVLTGLILLATKPSLIESFIYNKIHKQDIVFDK